MQKPLYKSRGIWLGAITALIGSLELIYQAIVAGDFSTLGLLTTGIGVLKVWERLTRAPE